MPTAWRSGASRSGAAVTMASMDGDPPCVLELRDRLALERTHLANERTLLAYVRTGLALGAAGAALLHFFGSMYLLK